MANAKKLTLNAPEVGAVITYLRMSVSEINFESGLVRCSYCRCTATDDVIEGGSFEFTMPGINLANIEAELIAAADFAEALPDGIIEDM